MKNIFKRGMSALSAAAMTAALAAVVPMSASADAIPSATQDYLKNLGAGWVLGNTFDATSGKSGVDLETAWQKDLTTEAAIKAVHAAGFETIRIPVSWGKHMNSDYVIDSAWMARVHQVVDWAYNDGMHVIINIHHDNLGTPSATSKLGFYPNSSHKEDSLTFVNSVWTQLSEEYKNYDDKLIFETLNEPRLCGTSDEWWIDANSPNANAKDAVAVIDAMNQSIVNIIRASGGNNANRYIICPGYAASINGAKLASMPSDPAGSGKILRSIHCYDPYELCLGSSTDHTSAKAITFSDSAKSALQNSFKSYKALADSGIPIIIDEMGITDKQNEINRSLWAAEAFRLSKESNIPCVMWDNNAEFTSTASSGWSEHHRHLNRRNGKWIDPKVIKAIMDSMGVSGKTITPDDNWAEKKSQSVTVTKSFTKTYGDSDFNLNAKSSGSSTLSYSSSSLGVATADNNGKVTIKGVGTATITVTALETPGYGPATATTTITVNPKKITPTIDPIEDQAYTGSEITPDIKVHGDGKVLSKGYYTVEYKNNINPGKATVTVTLKGNYTGSASTTFNIIGESVKPDKVKIKSATASTTAVTLKWNKAENATGYKVYRYDDAKSKWTAIATTTSLTYKDTGLKTATLYKYKVRAYNQSGSAKKWGSYSDEQLALTKPNATKILKVSKSTTSVKLTWKKISCTGYQVQKYDASKKKWVTVKTMKSAKSVSYKITGLKKNTSYKFRVRAYKKASGLKSYSAWVTKKVTTKK